MRCCVIHSCYQREFSQIFRTSIVISVTDNSDQSEIKHQQPKDTGEHSHLFLSDKNKNQAVCYFEGRPVHFAIVSLDI